MTKTANATALSRTKCTATLEKTLLVVEVKDLGNDVLDLCCVLGPGSRGGSGGSRRASSSIIVIAGLSGGSRQASFPTVIIVLFSRSPVP